MALPHSIRANDAKNPNREQEFEDALAVGAASFPAVIRAMMDAYIHYVAAHGRVPSVPFVLTEKPATEEKPAT